MDSNGWPKGPVYWLEGRTLCVTVPFTWNLPEVLRTIRQRGTKWDRVLAGGPAVRLMPDYFESLPFVSVGDGHPDALARVNPLATRTMEGCVRNCQFCAVRKIEPVFSEYEWWPSAPIVIDNNLLACSRHHFETVIEGLKRIGRADFNQGLDARLLTDYHAKKIAEIRKSMVRLALDSLSYRYDWLAAFERLRNAGIAKKNIRSYALVGFDSGPDEAWERCRWIESHGIKALPMWFHELDALKANQVTEKQKDSGWSDRERKKLMQWFYKHRECEKPRRKLARR